MSNIVQYTKDNLSTYLDPIPSEINWWVSDNQPDFHDDALLYQIDHDEDYEFGGLDRYDDITERIKFRIHNKTSTTRLENVKEALRDMCMSFTGNDRYSSLHFDMGKTLQSRNPNHFDMEGTITATINIVEI